MPSVVLARLPTNKHIIWSNSQTLQNTYYRNHWHTTKCSESEVLKSLSNKQLSGPGGKGRSPQDYHYYNGCHSDLLIRSWSSIWFSRLSPTPMPLLNHPAPHPPSCPALSYISVPALLRISNLAFLNVLCVSIAFNSFSSIGESREKKIGEKRLGYSTKSTDGSRSSNYVLNCPLIAKYQPHQIIRDIHIKLYSLTHIGWKLGRFHK